MDAITRARIKKDRQLYELRLAAATGGGGEAGGALCLQALHDLFGRGKKMFSEIQQKYETIFDNESHETFQEMVETIDKNGFDKLKNQRYAQMIEPALTNRTKDIVVKAHTTDFIAGMTALIAYILYRDYGYRKIRLKRFQAKLLDYAYLIKRGEVTIYEFMKCLQRECNVDFDVLIEYEKKTGKEVDIGPRKAIYLK